MNTGAPAFDGGGLSAATLQTIGAVLARFPQIDQALLYGSRAKGNFKPGSDIDLTLQGPALTQSVLGDIEEALDDLLLPYEIDLSIYEQLGNPELAAHIDRVGQPLYKKSLPPCSAPHSRLLRQAKNRPKEPPPGAPGAGALTTK